jgi:thioredoxin-dependent peroxiredoxin
VIFGVSPDSADADIGFRQAEGLPFDLLPDSEFELCRLYGVKVTNLLVFKLVERITYVIGKDGRIVQVVRDTRPSEHASSALRWL